jgi:hypothetical protein
MSAENEFQVPTPDPALRRLDFLVGTWELTGTTEAGPLGPPSKIQGTETFEWMEGGFFLIHQWKSSFDSGDQQMVDSGYEFFDYAPETGKYRTHFFNSLGPYDEQGSHYQGEFDADALVLVGPARFVRKPNPDGSIRYDCDFPGEDGSWTPFMHCTLTKIK